MSKYKVGDFVYYVTTQSHFTKSILIGSGKIYNVREATEDNLFFYCINGIVGSQIESYVFSSLDEALEAIKSLFITMGIEQVDF